MLASVAVVGVVGLLDGTGAPSPRRVYMPLAGQAPTATATATPTPAPFLGVRLLSVAGAPPGGTGRVVAATAPSATCNYALDTPGRRFVPVGASFADDGGRVVLDVAVPPSWPRGSSTVTVACAAFLAPEGPTPLGSASGAFPVG
jgi:hypothetical protein